MTVFVMSHGELSRYDTLMRVDARRPGGGYLGSAIGLDPFDLPATNDALPASSGGDGRACLQDYGDASARALTSHLRRMATQCFDSAALTRQAMIWLFEHRWVLPAQSRIEDREAAAQAYVTRSIHAEMMQTVGRQCVQRWVQDLSAVHHEETGETLFEWLRKPTTGTSQINIAEAAQRLDALRNLGADRLSLGALPITGMRHYASGMATQKVQTLALLREPRRAVEIGCWLRLHLLQLNDVVLEQVSRRIGNLWREAHETVEIRAFRELEIYHAGVNAIRGARGDPSLSDAALRASAMTRSNM